MSKLRGFTLIELLVVISIIALLMAMLLPALGRVKELAQTVVCTANLKQWALACSLYTERNNGYFPKDYPFYNDLKPYYENYKICRCPTATKHYSEGGRTPFSAWVREKGQTGPVALPGPTTLYGSYGVNNFIMNENNTSTDLWRTINIKGGSLVPMLGDIDSWPNTFPDRSDKPPEYDGQQYVNNGIMMRSVCLNRHNNGAVNWTFMDLSVKKIGLKQLWDTQWSPKWDYTKPLPVWPSWMRKFKD